MPSLAQTVKKKAVVPASYLPWGQESDFTGTAAGGHHQRDLQPLAHHDVQVPGRQVRNQNSYAAAG